MDSIENLLTTVWALRVPVALAVLAIAGAFHAAGILDRQATS